MPEKNEREKISALFMEDMDLMDSDQALKECIRTLKRQKLKEQIKSSRIALRDVESSGGDGSEYLNKIARLQKELDDLV